MTNPSQWYTDQSKSIGIQTNPSLVWIKTLSQAEGVQKVY